MTDDDQISALFDQMCRAWTAGDAVAYGRCFTSDCDYVSFDGYREQGRDAMVESHDRLFRGPEGWRCAAIHNGRVRPVGVPAPDSFPARTARVLVRASRALHLGQAPAVRPAGSH
jgi:hypothetical protein